MKQREQFRFKSRKAALCGMMAALSVAVLFLGGLIPFATVACPFLAMLCLVPVLCDYGPGSSLMLYAAAAILAVLLCPDKEIAFLYLFLSWYPSVRARLDPIPRSVRWVVKCTMFSVSMMVMYALLLSLFRLESVAEEFRAFTKAMAALLLLMGNLTFLIFDKVFERMSSLYLKKRAKNK